MLNEITIVFQGEWVGKFVSRSVDTAKLQCTWKHAA